MPLALRTWLFASAAAGLTACASNPDHQPAAIDYRGADPDVQLARLPHQPLVFADTTRPPPPPAMNPAPVEPVRPAEIELPPYQIVADLGPSTGVPAVAEARSMAAESGSRPGGARRIVRDDPAARAIRVQPRDTLYDISRRYNVNMRALIETNQFEPPYALDVGAVVYLPPPNVHVVEKGETLYSVSRRYNVDTRSLAVLNGMSRPWTVWVGDELLLPPLARDQARTAAKPIAVASEPPPVAPIVPPVQQAAAAPAPKAPSLKPAEPAAPALLPPSTNGPISLAAGAATPAVKLEPKVPPTAMPPSPKPAAPKQPIPSQPSQQTTSAAGEFIWPVSGSVLKAYGQSPDGQRNDGVNISAAKGAQVKAAAGGEVVYAGSELAGFGNLVLIRHPGGWVTAYAHADTILVSEGDLVKQGQSIATVGSTGNAAAPQVHFELRKGKEPVDPVRHLPALKG